MRLSGLWSAMEARCDHWLAEDGDTIRSAVFWADVLVALGLLAAQPNGPTGIRYQAVGGDSDQQAMTKNAWGLPSRLVQFEVVIMIEVCDRRDAWVGPRFQT